LNNPTKEVLDIIYNCPKAGIDVHLKINCEATKGFFGKKYLSQTVKRCDLLSQGGCTIRIDPAINSKCPAVAKAQKCSLK
jgi:hypothetical protein